MVATAEQMHHPRHVHTRIIHSEGSGSDYPHHHHLHHHHHHHHHCGDGQSVSAAATPYKPSSLGECHPWHHMAHAYTWVDEQQAYLRQKTHSHGSNKTEQWVLEQRVYFSHVQPQATRTRAQRQKAWEEMVHAYEVEANEWAQREAEIRRRVVRRELERARIIQEELRRTEERIKQKREAERRRIAEERAKAYLEMRELERREKQKHEKAMLEAWKSYESRWMALATSSEVLTFLTIPWPVLARPECPGDITLEDIKGFLLWSTHSQSQGRKERMRSAQLRWHPDRFRRFIKRVAEDERKEVEEGVGIVARCLNELMAKENERAL